MKVNVLLPVYNGDPDIAQTLNSLLEQTYKHFKVVVINDCSTDNTIDILNDYSKKDKRIEVFSLPKNQGITVALNKGISMLDNDCEYVIRIDSGDICRNDRIEKQVEFLFHNPDYALVGTQFQMVPKEGELTEGIIRFRNYSNQLCTYEQIKDNYTVMAPYAHPTLAFRRDVLMKLGGYAPDYIATEDYEIVGRIIKQGYRVGKIPKVLVECGFTPNKGISQEKRVIQVKTSLRIKLEYIRHMFLCEGKSYEVYIWGTREFAGYLQEEIENSPHHNMVVKAFTDFQKEKWGQYKDNLPIISPKQMIKSLNFNSIILTMCNLEREEIINFLNKNQLIHNVHYFVFS
ncbi:glycosyltransferase family 2 protein [Aneurinibacillus danicus]|uniref:Glycosyltransferase 2-like domain-containing protein n=1 Tax=Aneurinibacillus danicus TaxID=267746 RepID=A0A511VCV7_9BACL|nr:glycosyltransferase family A protein [Aneurinibacillus danicus]GEN36726.1 hypothetical protein ADA01nite_41860 [Aneurinibacillus danicus]